MLAATAGRNRSGQARRRAVWSILLSAVHWKYRVCGFPGWSSLCCSCPCACLPGRHGGGDGEADPLGRPGSGRVLSGSRSRLFQGRHFASISPTVTSSSVSRGRPPSFRRVPGGRGGGGTGNACFPPSRAERLSLARAADSPNLNEHFKLAVMIFHRRHLRGPVKADPRGAGSAPEPGAWDF